MDDQKESQASKTSSKATKSSHLLETMVVLWNRNDVPAQFREREVIFDNKNIKNGQIEPAHAPPNPAFHVFLELEVTTKMFEPIKLGIELIIW